MADDTNKPTSPKPAPRRAPRTSSTAAGRKTAKPAAAAKTDATTAAAPKPPRKAAAKPARAASRPGPKPKSAAAKTPVTPAATTTRRRTPRAAPATSNKGLTAAIVGGVSALGAIATGLWFALRGKKPTAHQPDGTDSSASFAAGIADEGTIPE